MQNQGKPLEHRVLLVPAVKKYDQTGLRSAMTATNPELEKSVMAHMPIHNVHYEYDGIGNEIVEACDKKGIPIPPGRRTPIAVPKRAEWQDGSSVQRSINYITCIHSTFSPILQCNLMGKDGILSFAYLLGQFDLMIP